MNDNIGKCDVFILFCSPNALKSKPIEEEWTAANMLGKTIIPVFIKKELIRRFEFLMDIADSSIDMMDGGGSVEMAVIDEEMRRVKTTNRQARAQ
ncbi:MAG: toll/interleukin-1 receptor domain-containing protein [Promethearchaeota archaeon]